MPSELPGYDPRNIWQNQAKEPFSASLDELRRALNAGELGLEGFQTALRLGGNALGELKRIVFQPPPRDD